MAQTDPLTAARLAAIVEAADDAILSKTLEGIIVSWNAAAERMYGYTAEEMIGESVFRLVPEAVRGEEEEILARVSRGEYVAHYETARQHRSGREVLISLTISPLRDQTGAIVGAASIQRDITERRRAEEAHRQVAKMEAIGRLAGGLAHDFNNQLYALSGFARFVARDPGLSSQSRQDLQEVEKAADQMASLTRQLLAFARQQVLSPETLDLDSAAEDARPMLQRLIGSDILVHVVHGPGTKWIRVDRSQLVQVLMNLVINSRDAMPRGGPLVIRTGLREVGASEVSDRLDRAVQPGTYVELSVEDSGEGIPPERLARIFEPFYTTKEAGRGTGLGLATVEGIVSQSGGHIQVESTVGQGTTIRILLPLFEEVAPEEPAWSPTGPRHERRERLLVVEDEVQVRAVVARMLRDEGFEVLEASNGREALDRLDNGKVDLVITDVVMPLMGGAELAGELARRYPDTAVVWMSGHPLESDLMVRVANRGQPFLQKPIEPGQLLSTIGRALQRTRQAR